MKKYRISSRNKPYCFYFEYKKPFPFMMERAFWFITENFVYLQKKAAFKEESDT